MKKKIKCTDEPMEFRVVDDFLPLPEQLAQKEDNVWGFRGHVPNSFNFF